MATHNIITSGSFILPGSLGNDVTVDPGLTVALTLTSVGVNTFSVSSNVGSTVTISSSSALTDVINIRTNGGTIILGEGLVNTLTTAQATVEGGGTYVIDGDLISHLNGGTISFQGTGGTNVVGTVAHFASLSAASIYSGFTSSADIIDDRSLSFSAFNSYSVGVSNSSGDQSISIFDSAGGGAYTFTVFGSNFAPGAYNSASGGPVTLSNDGANGTLITADGTPCYCRGTSILTDLGEVAVEDLIIGDRLVTKAGDARPIHWIGRRSYGGRFIAGNRDVLPVLISQGALSDNVPRRDLLVSPLHAMFLDGMLIPALALVNEASIIQMDRVDEVEYFHLELETHDIIHAEGALSETFVDDDSRDMFHNIAEHRTLYPHAVRVLPRYCAPRVEDGEELEVVRRRIAARTQPAQADETGGSAGTCLGHLDLVRRGCVEGWAHDEGSDSPVLLRVLDNGVTIGQVLADRYRNDIEKAGIGGGMRSFAMIIPGGLSPEKRHVIKVQRVSDGHELLGSPCVLEADSEPLRHVG